MKMLDKLSELEKIVMQSVTNRGTLNHVLQSADSQEAWSKLQNACAVMEEQSVQQLLACMQTTGR